MAKKKSKLKTKTTKKKATKKGAKKATKSKIIATGEISFDYIKSNQFRVVHVDGAHGGITPSGLTIQMALFSERRPIPKRETYELSQGMLGDRKAMEVRDAIVREVEVETIMDIVTAKRIIDWLTKKIDIAEQLQKELESK